MTLLGLVGIMLGLLGSRFAFIDRSRERVAFFFVAYVLHIVAALGYYSFSQGNVTDAHGYYEDILNYYEDQGFGYGTLFVTYVVQGTKRAIGGTFLDYFLLFQAISFFGICLLMRIIEEIYREIGIPQPFYAYLLPLLPGLHFWTSAIGKDGFLLLGVCLAIWGSMNLKKRYFAMAGGVAMMLIIRPYVAPLCLAALGATIFFDRGTPLRFRIIILAVSIGALGFALSSVQQSFAVDVTNAESVSEWLAAHEEITRDAETAGNSAVYGNYGWKLLSLLFRPLFVDAENIMGLAASVENTILLLLLVTIFWKIRTTLTLFKRLSFIRFTLIFGTSMVMLLALTYFNIGLGLRHKTMFLPAVMVVFVAVVAIARARRLFQSKEAPAAQDLANPSAVPIATGH